MYSPLCSMFPKSTHETFTNKLFQNFLAHARLEKAKFYETDFTISHYAGKACQTKTFVTSLYVHEENDCYCYSCLSAFFFVGHIQDRNIFR